MEVQTSGWKKMNRWRPRVISLLILSVVVLLWAISSGHLASRDQKMKYRFETIQRSINAVDLQRWATDTLSNAPNGRVWNIPEFMHEGGSGVHFLSASAFIHQEGTIGVRSVYLPFGEDSDSWWLIVGDAKFTLPHTNSSNRDYFVKWIPGVYFCYEK